MSEFVMSNAQASLTSAFKSLLENEDFVDVTLSAGGQTLRAHKVVLSACSFYFKQLLRGESSTLLLIYYLFERKLLIFMKITITNILGGCDID